MRVVYHSLRVRSPAKFFQMNHARSSYFSSTSLSPSRQTTRAQHATSHDQQPGEHHHTEAFVACQVPTDANPEEEKMFAVHGLAQAAQEVRKEYFPGSGGPYSTYVNDKGSAILTAMEAMKRKIAALDVGARESDERIRKAEARARESDERIRQAEARARESDERIKEVEVRAREADDRARETAAWAVTMEPLHRVAVEDRLQIYYNLRRLTGRATSDSATAVPKDNRGAFTGDFITDLAMFQRGDLKDGLIFYELYGVPYELAEPYKKSKTMVTIMNDRARIIANRGRSSEKWDQKRQRQFQKRISNFTNQSSKPREKHHDLQPHPSLSTEADNHLIDSRSLGQPTGQKRAIKDGLPGDEAEFYNPSS